VTLTDIARLANGFNPTGSITFTLFHNGTLVHTETVAVNGNAPYTTPTGFTLPIGGAAACTPPLAATVRGLPSNNPPGGTTTASASWALPFRATTPTITTVPTTTLHTALPIPVTLTDIARLANGFNPTGSITFTLFHNGTLVHTETVAVNGNAPYTTPTGFTL